MSKHVKHYISFILSLAIIFSIFSIMTTGYEVDATIVYNPAGAIEYAEDNFNNGVGECAEFVSNCLYLGGGLTCAYNGNSPYTQCWYLHNALDQADIPEYKLNKTNSYYLLSNNSNLVAAGDPIFFRCNSCPYNAAVANYEPPLYPHVVLCAGTNADGKLIYYAHNEDKINEQPKILYRDFCGGCGGEMDVIAMHIDYVTGQINIVFKKNSGNWPNPTGGNLAYVVNTATNTQYPLTKNSSATYKYSTANTLPYGTYKVYLPTGNGNATAYHSTVTLNSANANASVEANYYTLYFDGNEHTSGSPPASITRLAGQTAILPNCGSLAREDYTFLCWVISGPPYTGYYAGDTYTITETTRLYAGWRKNVTAYVNIKLNGVAWSGGGRSMKLRSVDTGIEYPLDFDATHGTRYYTPTSIPQGTYDIYVVSDGSSGMVKTGTFTLSQSGTTVTTATVNYYTVQFSGEGYDDGDEPADRICAANASMSVPDQGNLTKVGHSYCYWVSSLSNSLVIPNSTHKITGQQVLRAYWVEGNYRLGDVDHDGAITSTDFRLIQQYMAGKITEDELDTTLADYDGDGEVTSTDARLVLQYYTASVLATTDQTMLNSNGEPITWDDLDWSLLDWDVIDWDNFSFADLIEMLTAGNRNPDHEIM